jgi:hypothetical protein
LYPNVCNNNPNVCNNNPNNGTRAMPENKTFNLLSTSWINTPGVLRWAINGYKFKKDRRKLANVFIEGFGLDPELVHDLLSEKIPWKEVEGEHGGSVQITVP